MSFEFIPAGDPSILENQGVVSIFSPPPKQAVFSDSRGEIRRLDMAGALANMLFTKAGELRSGDMHPNTQFDFLLSGRCVLRTHERGQEVYRILTANQGVAIGPFVPHLFEFFEDTVMMEWWDGPFKCWYWSPYRDVIQARIEPVSLPIIGV